MKSLSRFRPFLLAHSEKRFASVQALLDDKGKLPLVKIVATIGPASEQLPMLSKVAAAGMRIMRINFSHATYEEADLRAGNILKCRDIVGSNLSPFSDSNGYTNSLSIMLDTQGPEIRTGSFAPGVKEVEITAGQEMILCTNDEFSKAQTASRIWISYPKLFETATEGAIIMVDDGAVLFKVESKNNESKELICRAMNSGVLSNKKGNHLYDTSPWYYH